MMKTKTLASKKLEDTVGEKGSEATSAMRMVWNHKVLIKSSLLSGSVLLCLCVCILTLRTISFLKSLYDDYLGRSSA